MAERIPLSRRQYAALRFAFALAREFEGGLLPEALFSAVLDRFVSGPSARKERQLLDAGWVAYDDTEEAYRIRASRLPTSGADLSGVNAPTLDADAASNLLSHWHAGVRAFEASHFARSNIASGGIIRETDGTNPPTEPGEEQMAIGSFTEKRQFLVNHLALEERFGGAVHSRLRTCLENRAFSGHVQPKSVVNQLKNAGYIEIRSPYNGEKGGRSAVTEKGRAELASTPTAADISAEEIDWNLVDFGFVPLGAAHNARVSSDPPRKSGDDARNWLPIPAAAAPPAQPPGPVDSTSITADPATWPEWPIENGRRRTELPERVAHQLYDADRAIAKAVIEAGKYDGLKETIQKVRRLTGQQVARLKGDLTRVNGTGPASAPVASPKALSREDEELIEDLQAELAKIEPQIVEIRAALELAQSKRAPAQRRARCLQALLRSFGEKIASYEAAEGDAAKIRNALADERRGYQTELQALEHDVSAQNVDANRLQLGILEARRDASIAAIADVEGARD